MDLYCTGGDWALQRSGAITLEGTDGFTVSDSLFEKVSDSIVSVSVMWWLADAEEENALTHCVAWTRRALRLMATE